MAVRSAISLFVLAANLSCISSKRANSMKAMLDSEDVSTLESQQGASGRKRCCLYAESMLFKWVKAECGGNDIDPGSGFDEELCEQLKVQSVCQALKATDAQSCLGRVHNMLRKQAAKLGPEQCYTCKRTKPVESNCALGGQAILAIEPDCYKFKGSGQGDCVAVRTSCHAALLEVDSGVEKSLDSADGAESALYAKERSDDQANHTMGDTVLVNTEVILENGDKGNCADNCPTRNSCQYNRGCCVCGYCWEEDCPRRQSSWWR